MKNKVLKKIAAVLLCGAFAAVSLAGCGSKPEQTTATTEAAATAAPETQTSETTEETTQVELPTDKITFYIFGVDTVGYTEVDKGRSDMIKICQIDPVEKTIKFIGILRDTKAEIEGYEPQKINAAHMYGGADLAMQTINENFGLDIHEYVMINFSGLVQLIDKIGGVEVDIEQLEADSINWHDGDYVGDGRQLKSVPATEGTITIDGSQALALSRTRKIDSDYYRSARQNKVLKGIIEKLKETPVTKYPEIINDFFEFTQTSLTLEDVSIWTLMGLGDYEFSSYIVPDERYEEDVAGGADDTGSWVWQYDLLAAGERINSILDGTFEPIAEQNEFGETSRVTDGIDKCSIPLEEKPVN